jgi:hypothetical protein
MRINTQREREGAREGGRERERERKERERKEREEREREGHTAWEALRLRIPRGQRRGK